MQAKRYKNALGHRVFCIDVTAIVVPQLAVIFRLSSCESTLERSCRDRLRKKATNGTLTNRAI